MSAIPSKTGVPDIVNSKLTNTVDFHIASTNFNSILKSYIIFLALSKYYDSLKYESDPITAEATFWEQLANANINLQTFARNPKATKYLTRLEIQLNDNEFLKVNESGDPLIYISAKGNVIAETTEGRAWMYYLDSDQYQSITYPESNNIGLQEDVLYWKLF